MNEHVWVAIIAGGKGTRLFPISHANRPKQFCRLDEDHTFIQAVVENFKRLHVRSQNIVVITTDDNQTRLAKEQTLSKGVLSQNICQIDPDYGYAGAMIKAAEIIDDLDPQAIIINTPSDQFVVAGEDFSHTIDAAIEEAKLEQAVIVGVKVNDLVTAMGCGHVIYEETEGTCFSKLDFVEKPDRETADQIMRQGNSACNTGINVWKSKRVLVATAGVTIKGLETDVFMQLLGDIKVAVGNFEWHDCGTLKSLYEVSKKSPNHQNAVIGNGPVERSKCRRSLLYASHGMELRVTGAEDDAVICTVINERPVVVVASMAESQRIKDLADDYARHEAILTDDFSFGSRNNMVLCSNISDELIVGFVGVDGRVVSAHKRKDGTIEVTVSRQVTRS